MARQPRVVQAGIAFHATAGGNYGQTVFFAEAANRAMGVSDFTFLQSRRKTYPWRLRQNLLQCGRYDEETMSTFVLIHGGWHAAWCWSRLAALLEKGGHRVIAPDLPGHGKDPTPLSDRPYEMYVPSVCAVLDSLSDQAILVGHSSGGMIITEVSRRKSERTKALVYLSAFLLPPGKTPRDVMSIDTESMLRECLEIDVEKGVSLVKRECARKVFYSDCSETDSLWAISQLQPEPLIPPAPSASDSGYVESSTHVPRFYIECLQDKALGPRTQRWMYTESPCDAVYSLPTSHSPFLSAPAALTKHLLEIAERRT